MAVTLIWYIVVGVIAGILGNFMLQSYNSHFVGISFALSVNTVFFILRNRL